MIEAKVDMANYDTDEGRNMINELLHDKSVEELKVVFTKKDGSERIMKCTLSEDKIPTDKYPTTGSTVTISGSAARVFDTEANEWRSFRWDSIKSVSFKQ